MRYNERCRIELFAAVVSALVLLATIVWPGWIELLFHTDPDGGSGAVEGWVALGSGFLTIVFSVAARLEWRNRRMSAHS
jgi:hypothetical protein